MLFRASNFLIRFCLAGIFQLLLCFGSFAQSKKISGVITREDNTPLFGATITIKNSNKSTITDSAGSFSMHVNEGEVLLVSFIGYQSQEIKITGQTALTISLTQSAINLDEILVTGYTSQKIKDIAGSVASVKPKDLTAIPSGQVAQMLQGRVAGLSVISSGEPGAPVSVKIHGSGNFGNITPLFIIDGIQGDINSLNPDDIETLQVLKDAAAYSIYGVRGANGVIVVTTKKGRQGKTKISYDGYFYLEQPLEKGFDLLSPQENADLLWIALKNSGLVGPTGNPAHPLYGTDSVPVLPDYLFAGPWEGLHLGDPRADPSLYNLNPDLGSIYQIVPFNRAGTDWLHEMYKPTLSQNHTVTVSGGNEKNLYLFSLGYLDQQGTLINTFLKRYSARVNTQFNYKNNFHIGENLQLSYTENPQSDKFFGNRSSDAFQALLTDPSWPVYDIYGAYNPGAKAGYGSDDNPVGRRIHSKDNKDRKWQIIGNAFASLDFLKNFTLKTTFGGSLVNYYSYAFNYPSYDYPANGYPNNFNEASGYVSSWTWTNTLNYARSFANHDIKVLIGTEMIDDYNRETGGTANNLAYNDRNYWLLTNGDPLTKTNYSIAGISKLSSFISRVDYGFKDKFILSATLRRDGSSVFSSESRFGWFPAFAGAWRMTEEEFLINSTWLTELKLRASWGKTGFNGNTNPFNQYTVYGGTAADAYYDIFGNSTGTIQTGYRTVRYGNPKTGWQEDIVTNLGIDGIFWNGKLSIVADWYIKDTKGLLRPLSLPDILGDPTSPNVNIGSIRNKGIDLALGSKGKFSKDWRWEVLATFSHYDNKIIKLDYVPYFFDAFELIKNEVGHPINSFYGYKIIGFFKDSADIAKSPIQQAAGPGRFKYADVNGFDTVSGHLSGKPDGRIDGADRVHFGNPHPEFTLGLNIAIHYRNFDLSTFFYYSLGNDVLNLPKLNAEVSPVSVGNKTALYESWQPDRQNATTPIAEVFQNFSNKGVPTTYPLEDGSYLRNKSLIVGYSFPRASLNKIGIERLRIYVQVVNLFTITNYSGLDPELSRSTGVSDLDPTISNSFFGIDFGNYPNNQKKFQFGINLGL